MNVPRMADLDLAGKRVFIRADLNVPQDDTGAITDDTRIRASLEGVRKGWRNDRRERRQSLLAPAAIQRSTSDRARASSGGPPFGIRAQPP